MYLGNWGFIKLKTDWKDSRNEISTLMRKWGLPEDRTWTLLRVPIAGLHARDRDETGALCWLPRAYKAQRIRSREPSNRFHSLAATVWIKYAFRDFSLVWFSYNQKRVEWRTGQVNSWVVIDEGRFRWLDEERKRIMIGFTMRARLSSLQHSSNYLKKMGNEMYSGHRDNNRKGKKEKGHINNMKRGNKFLKIGEIRLILLWGDIPTHLDPMIHFRKIRYSNLCRFLETGQFVRKSTGSRGVSLNLCTRSQMQTNHLQRCTHEIGKVYPR